MKNKSNIVMGICWIINIIMLLVLILMPKDNDLYNKLYMLFMMCIFLFPLILTIAQVVYKLKSKENITIYQLMPNLGCILIILLTFIKFIQSIEKIAIFEMVVILLVFVALEALIGYVMIRYKDMSKKKYIFINLAVYVTLVLFFVCAMIMSYDYSTIW